eukprot:4096533-Prymnesium_polylepis.1
MSDAYEYSSPWIRSGDMYGTVPTNVPHLPKESCSSATHPKSETCHVREGHAMLGRGDTPK